MHKSMRLLVQKAQRRESKIQTLAKARTPEARKERMRMLDNRHWQDRELKGEFLTGNAHQRNAGSCTVREDDM